MGKKRLRDMTWDDYGISKNRYKELKAFCLQYDEKRKSIQRGAANLHYADQYAARNAIYIRDCRMIEEAAVKADPNIWEYMLRNVTQGLSYEHIEYDGALRKISICRKDFYGTRKLFFSILDKMQLDHKTTVKT